MKAFLCLIGFLGVLGCQASDNFWWEDVDGYDLYPVLNKQNLREETNCDHNDHGKPEPHVLQKRPVYLDQPGRPDQPDHAQPHHRHNINGRLERPCAIHDVNCIRSFFAKNSKCLPKQGAAPDPFIIDTAAIDTPHSNVTLTINNAQLRGLNSGKIKEFFINNKTETMVLEVEFEWLEIYSPRTVISYHRKGNEPIETSDFTLIISHNLSLTLTIPRIQNINPANGHVYSYLSEKPLLHVGPKHLDTSSKGITAMDLIWIYDVGMTAREGMILMGPQFMALYLQSKICDFTQN